MTKRKQAKPPAKIGRCSSMPPGFGIVLIVLMVFAAVPIIVEAVK